MTSWASPLAFLMFLPLLAALVWMFWQRRKMRTTLLYSSTATLKRVSPSLRSRLAWLPLALQVGAVVLAIIGLARPQQADTKIKRNVEGIDIMVVLDISDSMLIEDMKPENRLEASKVIIRDFIKGRVSDRIGLVVFAGESYTRVPLTLDYPLLLKNLSEVEITRNVKMGTAIGVGLANAVARLKDSTAKSRVVIFLTDGENNTGIIDPETAIDIAKGYGIRIYSVGMGRDGQAQLPVYLEDGFGRKIKRYRPIHSQINDALLKRMAQETTGKYWRANTSNELQAVFDEIDRLEKTKVEVNQYTRYTELFPPYVEWALLFLILGFFLGRTILRRGP